MLDSRGCCSLVNTEAGVFISLCLCQWRTDNPCSTYCTLSFFLFLLSHLLFLFSCVFIQPFYFLFPVFASIFIHSFFFKIVYIFLPSFVFFLLLGLGTFLYFPFFDSPQSFFIVPFSLKFSFYFFFSSSFLVCVLVVSFFFLVSIFIY